MVETYDLVVVGGGPGGYAAAIRASQLGINTVLIEKQEIGGTCLNVGCIPTKYFVEFANTFQKIQNASSLGINVTLDGIDLTTFQKNKMKIVNQLTGGVKTLLKKREVKVITGEAKFQSKERLKVLQGTDEIVIEAKNIIIAAGTRPAAINLAFDGDKIVSSTDVLTWDTLPSTMAIIGGGVVGMEFASIFSQLGVSVTVIEMDANILAKEDQDIVKYLKNELDSRGVSFYLGTKVLSADCHEEDVTLTLNKDNEPFQLHAEKVLVAAGRTSNADLLQVENAGVETDRGYILVNGQMRTNVDSIYAIGDIVPGWQLAHVAYDEGIIAAENIAGNEKEMDYSAVPRSIYTNPEISAVGYSEKEAKAKFDKVGVYTFPLQANGKALINGNGQANGVVKLVIEEEYGEILGLTMVGHHVNELISEVSTVMSMEGTVEEIAHAIHPHPSLSEVIKEVSLVSLGRPIHIP